VATPITSGKGKKKKISGDQLFFSAPLDAASAQNTSNYHVTQVVSKKKTRGVPVIAATYNSGNHSVSLTVGKYKPGKPLQVRISGLVAADGRAVGAFETTL
jgi:hypothetical protein